MIGLGVVNPYTRHPALVAMETAALAGIAPGRVVLGLGSSNRKWIEAQMAIAFKTPLRGLREGVEIVRRLLDGQRVTYAGEVFSVHDVALDTPPPARGADLARRQGTARARAGRGSRGRRPLLGADLTGARAPRAGDDRGAQKISR